MINVWSLGVHLMECACLTTALLKHFLTIWVSEEEPGLGAPPVLVIVGVPAIRPLSPIRWIRVINGYSGKTSLRLPDKINCFLARHLPCSNCCMTERPFRWLANHVIHSRLESARPWALNRAYGQWSSSSDNPFNDLPHKISSSDLAFWVLKKNRKRSK